MGGGGQWRVRAPRQAQEHGRAGVLCRTMGDAASIRGSWGAWARNMERMCREAGARVNGSREKEREERIRKGEKEKRKKKKGKRRRRKKRGRKRERAAVGGIRGDGRPRAAVERHAAQHAGRGKEREGTANDFGVGRRNAGKDFGRLGARTEKDSETIRAQ